MSIAPSDVFDGNLILLPLHCPEKSKKVEFLIIGLKTFVFFLNLILKTKSIATNDVFDRNLFLVPSRVPRSGKKSNF